MRRLILAAMVVLITCGCHGVSPSAGEEAVLIKQPLIFGKGGVVREPISTGLSWRALSTRKVIVDMRPAQYKLEFVDLMSKDGVPLDFDAIIRLQVVNSVELIQNFGENWFTTNVAAEFSNRVRQSVRKYGMNETAINTVAIEQIDDEVSNSMQEYFQHAKVPVKLLEVTVGKANPPDSIKNQRIETATQEQAIMTQQQRKLAEDARSLAEAARAIADNAYREAMRLNTDQFVQLERIKMLRETCGDKNCTFIEGGLGGLVLK